MVLGPYLTIPSRFFERELENGFWAEIFSMIISPVETKDVSLPVDGCVCVFFGTQSEMAFFAGRCKKAQTKILQKRGKGIESVED